MLMLNHARAEKGLNCAGSSAASARRYWARRAAGAAATSWGRGDRMAPQPPREPPDLAQHAAAGAALRAPADQSDDAPHAPQHVPVPGVEGDREGAVQHDGANVLGVPRGIHRHQERAVGIAPQVELVRPSAARTASMSSATAAEP
jgi:hypothetical protein